ncbi:hypothetical protein BJY52DRAFT_1187033 [Lactarius psammicola]|nr:hypothetical protein BJY52DRAFT_1187033 [Lactarius psammicola]
MSSEAPSKETPQPTLRSTTAARLAATNGPAAIVEARKNRKKRMKEADQVEATHSTTSRLTPTTMTITVPAEAVVDNSSMQVYPPSEPSPTPPPIPMPPFYNEESPSPLSSPLSHVAPLDTPRLSRSQQGPWVRLAQIRTEVRGFCV